MRTKLKTLIFNNSRSQNNSMKVIYIYIYQHYAFVHEDLPIAFESGWDFVA